MPPLSFIIGGILPSIFLGLGTVLVRLSMGAGASIPVFLATIGMTIATLGCVSMVATSGQGGDMKAIAFAVAMA